MGSRKYTGREHNGCGYYVMCAALAANGIWSLYTLYTVWDTFNGSIALDEAPLNTALCSRNYQRHIAQNVSRDYFLVRTLS